MTPQTYAIDPPRLSLQRIHPAWRVFLVAFAWLACLAWMRPLFLPDEGRYVGVAWEMVHSGNWLTPTLDGLPFFHKPPLFYWITALALQLFGPHEWAARSASVLAGSATVAAVYSTVRGWLGDREAKMAALVLATQPLFFGASQFANLDMLVAACIAISILLGARAALHAEAAKPHRSDLAGAYAAAALGVLAKGLIGGVLPALVLFAWLAAARRWRTIRALCWWPGVALAAVIVLPWFVAVQRSYPGFFHYFFVVQHLQRFAGSGFNNVQPVWFYVPVLFALVLPWSAWLLPQLRRSWRTAAVQPSVTLLMWVWLGVVLVFFSIPQSKLIGYVLPALVPVAVLVAVTAAPLLQASSLARRAWLCSACVAVLVCVSAPIAFAMVHSKSSRALALQLAAHRSANEGLAFLDDYRYDVPFYLRDSLPIAIVSDWNPVEIQRHDNWQKEVADAGSFAPVRAADRLISAEQFKQALCAGKIKWVIADQSRVAQYPFLAAAAEIAVENNRALWHTDASNMRFKMAVGCELPNRPGLGE